MGKLNSTTTTTTSPAATPINDAEASKMLAAALQQMDGIISGAANRNNNNNNTSSSDPNCTILPANILASAQALATILKQSGNMAPSPDPLTAEIINTWLETHLPRQDTDERLRRLQTDKESLALQVQVLTEQVSAQTEKIVDLERLVTDKTQLLNNTEDLLQRVSAFATSVGIQIDKQKEMLSRSSLETQKLELMSAMSELKLQQAALERENLELRTNHLNNNNNNNNTVNQILPPRRPPLVPGRGAVYSSGNSLNSTQQPPTASSASLHGSHNSLQNNMINTTINSLTPKTPPASYRRQIDIQYNSLPRQTYPSSVTIPTLTSPPATTSTLAATPSSLSTSMGAVDTSGNGNTNGSGGHMGSSGNGINSSGSSNNINNNNNTTTTTPIIPKQRNVAFAETEKIIEDNLDIQRCFTPQPSPSPSMSNKNKGLRSIFGKIKRSNSGNLEELPMPGGGGGSGDDEFKRGGVRSTAGARLQLNSQQHLLLANKPDKPFIEWDIDTVCLWFDEMGLNCYEDDVRKWLRKGGSELVAAAPIDIERELNLKSPLHRKKITLAITDMIGKDMDEQFLKSGKLDTVWILRWLDDVGLPQHKDTFSAARMDGRMLHKLTMDDLVSLHVTSSLHAASLRRGIQCMRENLWNPECLIRRSGTEEEHLQKHVNLWTAHRVMEWLRVVDLAEYAPNLRGAGIHGALMMYENRFTSELLADLLSIPPSKTLLRRHLGTHFKELLGRDVIQQKREAETTLGFQPLTLTAKIKTPKKSQFSLKRKKSTKGGDEWSDFVCPMGPSGDQLLQNSNQTNMMNPIVQEVGAVTEVVYPPIDNNCNNITTTTTTNNNINNIVNSNNNNNNDSPTSSRSSTS